MSMGNDDVLDALIDRVARDLTKAGFYTSAPNVKAAYTTEFKSGVTP